jgi:hypothetical protein
MKPGIWIGKVLVMIVVFTGIALGVGMATLYLWNWLVPELFVGPVITFWQAVGLLALSKLLFWGFGCKCGGHRHGSWKSNWKEKMSTMSPEDRERFKQKMKDKWCYTPPNTPEAKSGGSTG